MSSDCLDVKQMKVDVCNNIIERYGYLGRTSQVFFTLSRIVWDTVAASLLMFAANPILYELPAVPELFQVSMSILSMKSFDTLKKCRLTEEKKFHIVFYIIRNLKIDLEKILQNRDLLKNKLFIVALKTLLLNYIYNLKELISLTKKDFEIKKTLNVIKDDIYSLFQIPINLDQIILVYQKKIKNNENISEYNNFISLEKISQLKKKIDIYLKSFVIEYKIKETTLFKLLPVIVSIFKIDSIFTGLCKLVVADKHQKKLPTYFTDFDYIISQFKEEKYPEVKKSLGDNVNQVLNSIEWKQWIVVLSKLGGLYLVHKLNKWFLTLPAGIVLFKSEVAGVLNEIYNIYHSYKRIGSELFYQKLFLPISNEKKIPEYIQFQVGFYLSQFIFLKSLFKCRREISSEIIRKRLKNTIFDMKNTKKTIILNDELEIDGGCDLVLKQHCQNEEGEGIEKGVGICQYGEVSVNLYPFRFNIKTSDFNKINQYLVEENGLIRIGLLINNPEYCKQPLLMGIIYYIFNLHLGKQYNLDDKISVFSLTPTFINRLRGKINKKKAIRNCSLVLLARIYSSQFIINSINPDIDLIKILFHLEDHKINLGNVSFSILGNQMNTKINDYYLDGKKTISLSGSKNLVSTEKLIDSNPIIKNQMGGLDGEYSIDSNLLLNSGKNGSVIVISLIDIISDSLVNLLYKNREVEKITNEYYSELNKIEDNMVESTSHSEISLLKDSINSENNFINTMQYKNNLKKIIKNYFQPNEDNLIFKLGRFFKRKVNVFGLIGTDFQLLVQKTINNMTVTEIETISDKQLKLYLSLQKLESISNTHQNNDILKEGLISIIILENIYYFKEFSQAIHHYFFQTEVSLRHGDSYYLFKFYHQLLKLYDFDEIRDIFYYFILQKYHPTENTRNYMIDKYKNSGAVLLSNLLINPKDNIIKDIKSITYNTDQLYLNLQKISENKLTLFIDNKKIIDLNEDIFDYLINDLNIFNFIKEKNTMVKISKIINLINNNPNNEDSQLLIEEIIKLTPIYRIIIN